MKDFKNNLIKEVRARFQDDVRRHIEFDQPHVLGWGFGIHGMHDPNPDSVAAWIHDRNAVLIADNHWVRWSVRLGHVRHLVFTAIPLELCDLCHE